MSAELEIGSGVKLRPFILHGEPEGSEPAGWIESHPAAPQCVHRAALGDVFTGDCGGSVHVRRHAGETGPVWTVEQRDPLTLSPSIVCKCGGWHGWVRDGQWVPA